MRRVREARGYAKSRVEVQTDPVPHAPGKSECAATFETAGERGRDGTRRAREELADTETVFALGRLCVVLGIAIDVVFAMLVRVTREAPD